MDTSLLVISLIVIASATALNLFLTLRIARIVRPEPDEREEAVPLVGQSLPKVLATRRVDGETRALDDLSDGPTALVFLSANCPACKGKIPELVEILPATERAGVGLWIASADGVGDIAPLIAGSPLSARLLDFDPAARQALNPLGAAPLYVFIDETSAVRAGDYLGDENWESFLGQMREVSRFDEQARPRPQSL
jgi:hypothetical protein